VGSGGSGTCLGGSFGKGTFLAVVAVLGGGAGTGCGAGGDTVVTTGGGGEERVGDTTFRLLVRCWRGLMAVLCTLGLGFGFGLTAFAFGL